MAGRIPEIIYRKLASKQTGTLGVDTSMTKAIGAVGENVLRPFEEKAEAEAKAEAQKKQDLYDAEVSAKAIMESSKFRKTLQDIQENSTSEEEYEKKAQEAYENHISGLENQDVQNSFRVAGARERKNHSDTARKYFTGKQQETIEAGMEASIVEGENQAYDLGKYLGDLNDPEAFVDEVTMFTDLLNNVDATSEILKGRLAPGETDKYKQDGAVRIFKKTINGLLDSNNPEAVDQFLDMAVSGPSGSIPGMNATQIEEVRKYAADKQEAQFQEAKKQRNRDRLSTIREITNRIHDGDVISETDWDKYWDTGLFEKEEFDKLKRNQNSSKKVLYGDNPDSENALAKEFNRLDLRLKEAKTLESEGVEPEDYERQEDLEALMLADLLTFNYKVLEAEQEGNVGTETARKWIDRITPKFDEKMSELYKSIGIRSKVVREKTDTFTFLGRMATFWEYEDLNDMVYRGGETTVVTPESPFEQRKGVAELTEHIMTMFDEFEAENGRRMELDEADALAKYATRMYSIETNPEWLQYAPGNIVSDVEGNTFKVIGRYENGEPKLSPNLEAKVEEDRFQEQYLKMMDNARRRKESRTK